MTREEAITNLNMISIAFVDPVTREQRKMINDTFDMAIKALEQEPCDKCRNKRTSFCGNCNEYDEFEPCDAISREAVIGAICDYVAFEEYEDKSHTFTIRPLKKRIDELPSVQPKPCLISQEKSRFSQEVSQESSRNKYCEWGIMTYDQKSNEIIFDFSDGTEKRVSRADQEDIVTLSREEYDRLVALHPSRKGHWIKEFDDAAGEVKFYCSECKEWEYYNTDFCPNCGAKMLEPQKKRCADCNHYGKLSLDCGRCDDDCSMYEPQESEEQTE